MGKIGKKWTMIGMGAPFALGILLIMFAENSAMLIIGRLLYGFSSGAFGLLVPAYTSETAEQSIMCDVRVSYRDNRTSDPSRERICSVENVCCWDNSQ